MDKEEQKKYAGLIKELAILANKMNLIKAKYVKEIWADKAFSCDRKDTLRNAELTLRLADDKEYPAMLEQQWELEEQQNAIDDGFGL